MYFKYLILLCQILCGASQVIKTSYFDLHAVPVNDQIEFTITSSRDIGWVGIGFGKSMKPAEMFIFWIYQDQIVASRRSSKYHDLPGMVAKQDFKIVDFVKKQDGSFKITWRRPLAISDADGVQVNITRERKNDLIWAIGATNPASVLPDTAFSIHDDFGRKFQVDLFAEQPPEPSDDQKQKRESLISYHSLFMWFGWMVMAPLAILAARYFKDTGDAWFKIHSIMMLFVLPVSFLGLYFAYQSVEIAGTGHYDPAKYPSKFVGLHVAVGLFILIIANIQVALGFIIDRLYSPNRTKIPIRDKIHWYIGRVLVVAAFFNIPVGFFLSDSIKFSVPALSYIGVFLWMIGIICAFAVYEIKKGKKGYSAIH